MLRRLYDRLMTLAASPQAPVWLAAVAFAESSVFPAPPDLMLAPMVLARPEHAWRNAAICTAGSVVGGVLGYTIGYFLGPVGQKTGDQGQALLHEGLDRRAISLQQGGDDEEARAAGDHRGGYKHGEVEVGQA